jgi:hypothetical protein
MINQDFFSIMAVFFRNNKAKAGTAKAAAASGRPFGSQHVCAHSSTYIIRPGRGKMPVIVKDQLK